MSDYKDFDPKAIREKGEYNEHGTRYPVPGFRNLPWHATEEGQPKLMTPRFKAYNAWAKAHGEQEMDENEVKHPGYSFIGMIGKDAPLEAQNLLGGTFTIDPDTSYGIGSHPNCEVYIVLSGEGEFYNYDRVVKATKGTWIMLRPFDLHGIINTGKEPLELMWFWWNENPDMPNWDCGGLPVSPKECWQDKGNNPGVKPVHPFKELEGDERYVFLKKGE